MREASALCTALLGHYLSSNKFMRIYKISPGVGGLSDNFVYLGGKGGGYIFFFIYYVN